MAVRDAMSHYLNEMGTDRFDLLDVSIVMGAVMERIRMYMKNHAFEHLMT